MSKIYLGEYEVPDTKEKYCLVCNSNCKKCWGRGFQGINIRTKEKIGCTCLKRITILIKKENNGKNNN